MESSLRIIRLRNQWFAAEAAAGWRTCLLTQTGFVRLCLNPLITQTQLSAEESLQLLEGLVAHPNHAYLEDQPALTSATFRSIVPSIRGYHQIPDATLLHLARHNGARLVTFDHAISSICPWRENLLVLRSLGGTPVAV